MRERNVFLGMMDELARFFSKTLSDAQQRFYWNECGHWQKKDLENGINEIIRTKKPMPSNFPTINELNLFVEDMGGIDTRKLNFIRTRCHACYDRGYLSVKCKPKHDPPYEEIFRCGHCRNWSNEDFDKPGYKADKGNWRFIVPTMTLDEFDLIVREKYRIKGIEASLIRHPHIDKKRLDDDKRFNLKEGLPVDECYRREEAMMESIRTNKDVQDIANNLF